MSKVDCYDVPKTKWADKNIFERMHAHCLNSDCIYSKRSCDRCLFNRHESTERRLAAFRKWERK